MIVVRKSLIISTTSTEAQEAAQSSGGGTWEWLSDAVRQRQSFQRMIPAVIDLSVEYKMEKMESFRCFFSVTYVNVSAMFRLIMW
jgi:hypothetical protein